MTKIQAFAKQIHDEFEEGRTDALLEWLVRRGNCTECGMRSVEPIPYTLNGKSSVTYCKMLASLYHGEVSFDDVKSCAECIIEYWNEEEEQDGSQ